MVVKNFHKTVYNRWKVEDVFSRLQCNTKRPLREYLFFEYACMHTYTWKMGYAKYIYMKGGIFTIGTV